MLIKKVTQAIALAIFLAPAAYGQNTSVNFGGLKADTTLPVELSSDKLEINQADGSALFSGDVLVKQGQLRLSANTVQASYGADGNVVETIVASGKVTLANAKDAAEADSAVYTISSGKIIMTGHVLLTQGNAAISAQKMVIDLKSGTGQMEGRVTTTFVPGKKK